ncbi:hypothetical protein Tco_1273479 [Tanacetum coccineum]
MQCLQQRHEYVALSSSCAQVMWMRTQHKDYGFNYNKIPLYCDSRVSHTTTDSNLMHPVQHLREQTHPYSALPEDRNQSNDPTRTVDLPKDNPKLEKQSLGHIPFQTLVEHHQVHKLLSRVLRNIHCDIAKNIRWIQMYSHEDGNSCLSQQQQALVDKFENASKSLNKLIECQIVDNCKKGLGYENYNAVPPPYIGNFMPPMHYLSFTGLYEFVNEPVVENYKAMSSEEEPKVVRKSDDSPIIKD